MTTKQAMINKIVVCVQQQTLIEYLWSLPPGSFDDDNHAAANLVTVFGVTEDEARRAVQFGPGYDE